MIGVNNIRHGRGGIQPVHISAGTVRMYHVCTLLYSIHLGYHFKICMLDPMLISLISHDNVMLGMAAHSHFHMSIWFLVLWTQPCSQLARENRRATSTSTSHVSRDTGRTPHSPRPGPEPPPEIAIGRDIAYDMCTERSQRCASHSRKSTRGTPGSCHSSSCCLSMRLQPSVR